jgi:probable F420-dependent oxidoreductase
MAVDDVSGSAPEVRIGIGLFTAEVPPHSGRTLADEYADTLRLAERAEQLGFDSLWTSEHHGVSDGYLPSQLVLLSAVAAVTERMRLGTGVLVAATHDPLRLAEDAAVLDQLSRGRLTLGLGLGWRPEEFRMFGVSGHERVARLTDAVHVLRKAFTGERFSHAGSTRAYTEVLITPKPYQPGGPPILLGGSSPAAIRRAGLLGDGFIRSWRDRNADLASDVRAVLAGVGDDHRSAEDFEFVLLQNLGLVDRHAPDRTARISASLAYQLGVYSALHDGDDTPGRGFQARAVPPSAVAAAALWGTPQQVATALAALVIATGPVRRCELVVRLNHPGMDLSDSLRLLELFSSDVRPRLQEALAARRLPSGDVRSRQRQRQH